MKGKKALPINPQAWVTLREMPGTRVAFWVVESCPYCTKQHFHLAGARDDDPEERLGEVKAPCQSEHSYILSLPPRAQTKGGKRAQQRRERRENKALSKHRIVVEHVLRRLKVFRVLKGMYRHCRRRFRLRLNLICALYNLDLTASW